MIAREDAQKQIVAHARVQPTQTTPLAQAAGRVLAQTVPARLTQPPAALSAMDGYAVRHRDASLESVIAVIGEAPAGAPFSGGVGEGQAVRVFTGSVVPDGADHVVIQEDVERTGDHIRITAAQPEARNIRPAGIDFREGDVLLASGQRLDPAHLAVAAAANHASLETYRRPRVGVLANGDELRAPGNALGTGEIVCSTPFGLIPLIEAWGGEAVDLGVARDDLADIRARLNQAQDLDIIVPLGGASVGDHDHMQAAFAEEGFESMFSKVAVKPGKPTWFGALGARHVLGLPGNPASALVCAHLFLKPLLYAMTGRPLEAAFSGRRAQLTAPVSANGRRETFLRATVEVASDARLCVTPASRQDSSLLTPFLSANALIHRAPDAEACVEGETVWCVNLAP